MHYVNILVFWFFLWTVYPYIFTKGICLVWRCTSAGASFGIVYKYSIRYSWNISFSYFIYIFFSFQLYCQVCWGVLSAHESMLHRTRTSMSKWRLLSSVGIGFTHFRMCVSDRIQCFVVWNQRREWLRFKSVPQWRHLRSQKLAWILLHVRHWFHRYVTISVHDPLLFSKIIFIFRYAGEQCESQDHCASQPCRNGAKCLSTEDSYKCECAAGFTGPQCGDDVVECKMEPCKHGTCYNTHGSYSWVP